MLGDVAVRIFHDDVVFAYLLDHRIVPDCILITLGKKCIALCAPQAGIYPTTLAAAARALPPPKVPTLPLPCPGRPWFARYPTTPYPHAQVCTSTSISPPLATERNPGAGPRMPGRTDGRTGAASLRSGLRQTPLGAPLTATTFLPKREYQ
eukprot:COSAG04_NODE_393_length_15147_cov_44.965643_2_plen_151_part_00